MKPLVLLLLTPLCACAITSHAVQPSALGVPRGSAELLAVIDLPGPVTVESVDSADWEVPLSGLLDLDDPRAKEAGLTDRPEPIQIWFHALRHPSRGLYLVDTGVERAMRDRPEEAALRGAVARVMHFEKLKFQMPLGDWLAKAKEPLRGVFLTHLHSDHLTGMADAPAGTDVYTGPGEAAARAFLNLFVQPNTDRALSGKAPISEWAFAADPQGRFAGVIDIFGDGTVWALSVPGHTPGSVAYLVRTPRGPLLLTGDTSHTRWGWDHGVAPGSFTADHPANERSLAALQKLAAEHPALEVRLGHQR